MKVTFEGGERGLYALVAELESEGLHPVYEEPLLTRSAGQSGLVHVVIYLADPAVKGAIAGSTGLVGKAAVERAIERYRKRFPHGRAEFDDN